MRNKITSPVLLDKILEYLIGNSSISFSGKKVTNVLNENGIKAVSYTHLDVYKRQTLYKIPQVIQSL